MTNIEIGKRIKYARELRNTTLDDVARIVGVAKSTVQRYENGKIQTIKLPVVESIANALDVNPAWLVGKSDEMEVILPNASPIMHYFNLLNDLGKKEAEKRVQELTMIDFYVRDEKTGLELVIETRQPRNGLYAVAAHNDHADEPGELEKMQEDIAGLKRPD